MSDETKVTAELQRCLLAGCGNGGLPPGWKVVMLDVKSPTPDVVLIRARGESEKFGGRLELSVAYQSAAHPEGAATYLLEGVKEMMKEDGVEAPTS